MANLFGRRETWINLGTGPLNCTGSPKLFLLFRIFIAFYDTAKLFWSLFTSAELFHKFFCTFNSLPCERLFTQMSPENFHNKWTTGVQIWVLYRRSSFRCFGSRQPRRINVGISLAGAWTLTPRTSLTPHEMQHEKPCFARLSRTAMLLQTSCEWSNNLADSDSMFHCFQS